MLFLIWNVNSTLDESRVKVRKLYRADTYDSCTCTFLWAFHLWCPRDSFCSKTKPCTKRGSNFKVNSAGKDDGFLTGCTYRLTSSADWAIKKPWVLRVILIFFLGLMAILESAPSSTATSMARSRSFNFTKQSLKSVRATRETAQRCNTTRVETYEDHQSYSAAWGKVMPVKEADKLSVYISIPVPQR